MNIYCIVLQSMYHCIPLAVWYDLTELKVENQFQSEFVFRCE